MGALSADLLQHWRGLTIRPKLRDLSFRIDLEDIDPFEDHFPPVLPNAASGPLHGRSIARYKHVVLGQAYRLEQAGDALEELPQRAVAFQRRAARGIVTHRIRSKRIEPRL